MTDADKLDDLQKHGRAVAPPKIDAFSMHEVLHVASLIADLFDREICEHPAVMQTPQLWAKAVELVDALGGFYQLVGSASFTPAAPGEERAREWLADPALKQSLRDFHASVKPAPASPSPEKNDD